MNDCLFHTPTEQLESLFKEISRELSKRRRFNKSYAENKNSARRYKVTGKGLRSIPYKRQLVKRYVFIDHLLCQDWNHLYSDNFSKEKKFYVYAHVDPRVQVHPNIRFPSLGTYKPFYIGKGTGDRWKDTNRNQGHNAILKEIKDDGYDISEVYVKITPREIKEKEALILESKLIYFYRTVYEDQKNGFLVNLDTGKRPAFKKDMELKRKDAK